MRRSLSTLTTLLIINQAMPDATIYHGRPQARGADDVFVTAQHKGNPAVGAPRGDCLLGWAPLLTPHMVLGQMHGESVLSFAPKCAQSGGWKLIVEASGRCQLERQRSQLNALRRTVETCANPAQGIRHMRMTQHTRKKHWWKDIDMVRQELEHFCDANALDNSTLPSTSQLRICPGGNHLIHAIHQHNGIANFSIKLGIPAFSAEARLRAANKRNTQPAKKTPHYSQTTRKHTSTQAKDPLAKKQAPASGERKPGSAANQTTPHGYFADSSRFRAELIAFGKEQTNNPSWKVLPSPAQLRRSCRMDLARAILRYGGSDAVASRFGMLSASEYAYHHEFYTLLRELKAYQLSTDQIGMLPPLQRMKEDGRSDLVRLIRRHGGKHVLAARLFLDVNREHSPFLRWGVFDLDFAIDLLNVSQVVALELGTHYRIVLPNDEHFQIIGRPDLPPKIEEYGGRVDVARRLGMDAEPFPQVS